MQSDETPLPLRRVVVVLGMHRSGTSAVAGCLQRLGVDFGPRLMPPTPDNPRGYYEHIDVANLHDRLLAAFDRSWDDVAPMPARWWEDEARADTWRTEMLAVLKRDFPSVPLWGIKDPRLCRLLPWWESLWRELGSAPYFLLVRRSPDEVAESLARREGFSAAKSYLLWLEHALEAERSTRGHPRAFVNFDVFLADPVRALGPVAAMLRQTSPLAADSRAAGIGSFVDPGVSRSLGARAAADELPLWVAQADAALQLGVDGQETEMQAQLDVLSGHLQSAATLFTPAVAQVSADLRLQAESIRAQARWYSEEWLKACRRIAAERERLKDATEKLSAEQSRNTDCAKIIAQMRNGDYANMRKRRGWSLSRVAALFGFR